MRSSSGLRRAGVGAVLCLAIALGWANAVWLRADHATMPGVDPYLFLNQVLRFLEAVEREGLSELIKAPESLSNNGRPPLYLILAAPFVALLGGTEGAALSVNLLFGVLLLFATYALGTAARSERVGLLAALLVATYPPILLLFRAFRPHYAVPACVALSLWLLLEMLRRRSPLSAWLFGLSLAFGFLVHPLFIYVLAGPTLGAGMYALLWQKGPRRPASWSDLPAWIVSKLEDRFVLRGLLPAALISLAALAWYVANRDRFSRIVANWSRLHPDGLTHGFPDVDKGFFWYLQTAPGALSNVLAGSALIGLIAALLTRRGPMFLLAGTLVVGYAALAMQATLAWWYFAALLPVVAVLSAGWIFSLRPRGLAFGLAVFCCVVAVFNYRYVAWGDQAWSRPLAKALGSPLGTETCSLVLNAAYCPSPPWKRPSPFAETIRILGQAEDCRTGCRLASDWQVSLLHYHMKRARPQPNIELKRVDLRLKNRALVGIEQLLASDYFLGLNAAAKLEAMFDLPKRSLAGAFETVAKFHNPDGSTWKLEKRVGELGREHLALDPSVLLANFYRRRGKFESAKALYRKALPTSRDPVAVKIFLAKTLADRGRVGKAVASFNRVIREAPGDPRPLRALADLHMRTRKHDRALDVYQRLGTEKTAGEYAVLAQLLLQRGDLEAAIRELHGAVTADPRRSEWRRQLLELYRETGRLHEAHELYLELVTRYPEDVDLRYELALIHRDTNRAEEAVGELRRVVAMQPDVPRPWRILASITYRQLRDAEQAVPLYEEYLRRSPDDVGARLDLARALHDLGQSTSAVEQLETVLEHHPDHPGVRRVQADFHLAAGETQRAIEVYEELARDGVEATANALRAAALYEKEGRNDLALETLQRLSLSPESWEHGYRLSRTYHRLGASQEAVRVLEELMDLQPSEARNHAELAAIYLDEKLVEKAALELERVLELRPADIPARLTLASIYSRDLTRLSRVTSLYEEVNALDAKNAKARLGLGKAYLSLGEEAKAAAELEIAVSLRPKHRQAHELLADSYRLQGEVERAEIWYRKLLELDPRNVAAKRALCQLERRRPRSSEGPS